MLLRVARTQSRRALSTKRVVLQRPAEAGSAYERFEHNTEWSSTQHNESQPWKRPLAPFLPAGYPQSVKDGYGTYALLQFAGFACSSAGGVLSTRVLLTAVGVGDASAAPLAAAANWAVKDGLGMLGGVAFASIWSGALDARPRRWRLRSSVALDAAALVELAALPAFPQYFVPIAGLANVAKNISYLAASASRAAIHRALSNRQGAANLGDLTAKSGSQTIVASLVGLGLGVGVSNACGGDVTTVWPAWAALSATHLTCTWLSLRYVADVELDPPRLAALVDAFLETGTCPTPAETSSAESLLVGGGDPSWLSVGDRVDAFPSDAFGEGMYVIHAEQDVARLLLYDDAAPRDALEAAVHARARLGASVDPGAAEAFAAAVAEAGWRVDELPVAFDRGRLLREAPEVKEE